MRAVVYEKYGSPEDVLRIEEVEKPAPKDDEVLVKVYAASVNYADWANVRGKPFLIRLIGSGLFKPVYRILGADIAGRVVEVGRDVTSLSVGDEVYGDLADTGFGGFAEYVSVHEDALYLKPVNLSFIEAATVPQAAIVALQGLRLGEIESGKRVLINGASGGIGSFAVQIAKSYGALVTGVCSTENLDWVLSLGANHVVDYTKDDFTQKEGHYDLILDIVANRSLSDYLNALNLNGHYVAVAFNPRAMIKGSNAGGKKISTLSAKMCVDDLVLVKALVEDGSVKPVVDRCFSLDETAAAIRYYGERHSQGKVVITVQS